MPVYTHEELAKRQRLQKEEAEWLGRAQRMIQDSMAGINPIVKGGGAKRLRSNDGGEEENRAAQRTRRSAASEMENGGVGITMPNKGGTRQPGLEAGG